MAHLEALRDMTTWPNVRFASVYKGLKDRGLRREVGMLVKTTAPSIGVSRAPPFGSTPVCTRRLRPPR